MRKPNVLGRGSVSPRAADTPIWKLEAALTGHARRAATPRR